jgi:hypothetical protein
MRYIARVDRVYRTGVIEPFTGSNPIRDIYETVLEFLLPHLKRTRLTKLDTWRKATSSKSIGPVGPLAVMNAGSSTVAAVAACGTCRAQSLPSINTATTQQAINSMLSGRGR